MAEVEASTKIRAKYLRAIENEEWELLPGPVYVKSFLRTYGDYLGLDSRMLVDEFKQRYERPAENELQPIAPLRRERERELERERAGGRRFTPPPWAVIAAVLVGVLVVLAVIGLNSKGTKSPTTAGVHAGTHKKKHPTTTTTKTSATAPTHKFRTVTLQLVPTGSVYVCLVNGAGKKLISGVTYNPGQTIPKQTAREFYLTLGNASMQMKVNGKPIAVHQGTTPLGYRIRPRGTSTLPAGSQPTCT